jgi:hypothetical protein
VLALAMLLLMTVSAVWLAKRADFPMSKMPRMDS